MSILFYSCQKNITINPPKGEKKIVVEGYIENGKTPYVFLTHNSTSVPTGITPQPISNAFVIVSDGQSTDTLKEISSPSFAGIYFSLDSTYIGKTGKTYSLTVVSEGKKVTAVTTIPSPVALDSIWWQEEVQYPNYGYAHAILSDPAAVENQYKLYAKELHNDDDFISPLGDTFDDKFFNGQNFSFFFGHGKNVLPVQDGMFAKGDTFVTKFCSIDKNTFEFWRTFELEINTNGNPFASPTSIQSNITGGLGIWGGYGVWLDTTVAK